MNTFIAILVAALCFFLLGCVMCYIPKGANPAWCIPLTLFVFAPSLILGIVLMSKYMSSN